MEISVAAPKVQKSHTGNINLGDNLAASIQLFGEDVVHGNFLDSAAVKVQAFWRRCLEKGMSNAEIDTATLSWKLGVKATRIGAKREPSITQLAAEYKAEGTTAERKLEIKAKLEEYVRLMKEVQAVIK